MIGCNICSDNYIRRRKLQGNQMLCHWNSLQSWCRAGKERWKEQNKRVWQWLTFIMSFWMTWHNWQNGACPLTQNLTLLKKDPTWWAVTIWVCQKEWATAISQRSLSDGIDTDILTVSLYSPRKKLLIEIKFTLGKLMCSLRKTSKEHKIIMPSCPHA